MPPYPPGSRVRSSERRPHRVGGGPVRHGAWTRGDVRVVGGARRPDLLILALLPSVMLGLLNGWYGPLLTRIGPLWFWLADLCQFVLVPLAIGLLLLIRAGVRPSDYGFRGPNERAGAWRLVKLSCLVTVYYWLAYEVSLLFVGNSATRALFVDSLPETQPWRDEFPPRKPAPARSRPPRAWPLEVPWVRPLPRRARQAMNGRMRLCPIAWRSPACWRFRSA